MAAIEAMKFGGMQTYSDEDNSGAYPKVPGNKGAPRLDASRFYSQETETRLNPSLFSSDRSDSSNGGIIAKKDAGRFASQLTGCRLDSSLFSSDRSDNSNCGTLKKDAGRFASQPTGCRLDSSLFSSDRSDNSNCGTLKKDGDNGNCGMVKKDAGRFASQFSSGDGLPLSWAAAVKPSVSFKCYSQATTTASLPGMTATAESLPSAFPTKDSLPAFIATKDSLPALYENRTDDPRTSLKECNTRSRSKRVSYSASEVTSRTMTSASASEDSQSDGYVVRKTNSLRARATIDPEAIKKELEAQATAALVTKTTTFVAEATTFVEEAAATESATEASEDQAQIALLKAKEAWKQRREAKKAKRQGSKRPSYGELLRKSSQEKKNCMARRPPSPSSCLRKKNQPEPEAVPEAPRIIDPAEALGTIMSVSCGTSVVTSHVTSHRGSRLGSRLGSQFASRSGSKCNTQPASQAPSRGPSRPISRHHTLDALPEFSIDLARNLCRTTTRDSLPPIGDDTESEDSTEEDIESNTEESPASSEAEASLASARDAGLEASLRAAYEEIAAMQTAMEELQYNNDKLSRENEVLKAFATWEAECQAGAGGNDAKTAPTLNAKERWLKRREELRERRNSNEHGKVSYGAWLQAQHEQSALPGM